MTKADAIRALFQVTTLGVELDEGLTAHTYRSGGKVGGVELCGRTETISIPASAIDNLIAVLQAVRDIDAPQLRVVEG